MDRRLSNQFPGNVQERVAFTHSVLSFWKSSFCPRSQSDRHKQHGDVGPLRATLFLFWDAKVYDIQAIQDIELGL